MEHHTATSTKTTAIRSRYTSSQSAELVIPPNLRTKLKCRRFYTSLMPLSVCRPCGHGVFKIFLFGNLNLIDKNDLLEHLFKVPPDNWILRLKWLSSAWAGKIAIWKVKLVSWSTFSGSPRLLNSWAEMAFQRLGRKNINLIGKNDFLGNLFRVPPIIEFLRWNGFPALAWKSVGRQDPQKAL